VAEKGKPKGSGPVDPLVEEHWKTIENILLLAELEQEGELQLATPPESQEFDIIRTLARLVVRLRAKRRRRKKKELSPEQKQLVVNFYEEINNIYPVIRKVGFSGYVSDAERERAALEYFDQNRESFTILQRRWLTSSELYAVSLSNPYRDFAAGLFRKLAKRHGIRLGGYRLRAEMVRLPKKRLPDRQI
jgi:hypothetical protein